LITRRFWFFLLIIKNEGLQHSPRAHSLKVRKPSWWTNFGRCGNFTRKGWSQRGNIGKNAKS